MLALLFVLTASCSSPPSGGAATAPPAGEERFSSRVARVVIEIDYASAAPPYTGAIGNFGDPFSVFRANARALFGAIPVTVPSTLDAMERLDDVKGGPFTRDDILAIAAKHRDEHGSPDTASIYFVWLDGYYVAKGVIETSVLGITLEGTGVIALFKPAIEGSTSGDGHRAAGNGQRFVEQSTMVHELGHAVGLVGTTVPAVTDHVDREHGAHCTNPSCVMYWTNDGRDAIDFAKAYLSTGNEVLFGPECLDDLHAAGGGS
jgi:hypothetical protein